MRHIHAYCAGIVYRSPEVRTWTEGYKSHRQVYFKTEDMFEEKDLESQTARTRKARGEGE